MGLGIAGLILGILSIPLAVTACTFMSGLVLGILGIVFAGLGLSQARRAQAPTQLVFAGLVVSIIGTSFALLRLTNSIIDHKPSKLEIIRKHLEEHADDMESTITIQIDKDIKSNLEEILIDLEEELHGSLDEMGKVARDSLDELKDSLHTIVIDIKDEASVRRVKIATKKALKTFVDEMDDTSQNAKKEP